MFTFIVKSNTLYDALMSTVRVVSHLSIVDFYFRILEPTTRLRVVH